MDITYSRPHLRLWQLGYLLTAAAVAASSCASDFRTSANLPMNRLMAGHALLVFISRRRLRRVIERAMLVSETEQNRHSFVTFILSPVWAGLALHHALGDPNEVMKMVTLPLTANCLAAGAFAALPCLLRLHREVRICEKGLLIGKAPLNGTRISRFYRVSPTVANLELLRGGMILLVCCTATGCNWVAKRVGEEGDKK